MINIANLGIKNYEFKDNERIIKLKNPTQETWLTVYNLRHSGDIESLRLLSSIFNSLLYEEDKEYEQLDFSVKTMLFTDYLKFHKEQLEERFPGSSVNRD